VSTAAQTFRENVRAYLQDELGIPFVAGMLVGGESRPRTAIGCVWVAEKARVEPATDENITLLVRVFPPFSQTRNQETPFDPTPLEDLADAVQLALAAVQTTMGPWLCDWQRTTLDMEDQAFEMEFRGWQNAYGETGG
jgi:hypothetical protein